MSDKKKRKAREKADRRDKADRKRDRMNRRMNERLDDPTDHYRPYRITSLNRRRLAGGFAVIILMMIGLIYRLGYWQIVRAEELKVMAVEMQKVDTQIDPVRGSIYDSRMNTLAETVTEYELYGYTQYLYKDTSISMAEKTQVATDLAKITGSEVEDMRSKLLSKENLTLLAGGLTKKQVEQAQKKFGSKVSVRTKSARYYPNGAFASQILGGVNSDGVGRSGLEYQYNSVLAGVKGRTVRTTDPNGDTLSGSRSRYYNAQDGGSIVTTIDSVIQNFTEDALETGMQKTGAEAITCIVTDPKTGNILAMASTPEYDPNNSSEPYTQADKKRFRKMSDKEKTDYLSRMWTVRGISNVYEPGSTFKLITAASALESDVSDKNSRYYCEGYIHVDNYNLRCLGIHGKQDLKEAVGNSCNPALAQVALDMGSQTFYNYIDLFGFNDRTGIDLPGETNSIVKDPDGMGNVDLATTGYGQGIAVTPLQILCAVNCFGNDGVLMKPKLVSRIVDQQGNTVETIEDQEVRQVVSEETARKMREIMEYYVSDAGGSGAYVPGYRVGGKTGTANLVDGGRTYSSHSTNTSFVAMAPMDDPVISMICIVYKPTRMQYGNFTAGPIVKEIMEKSLEYLGVKRKYTKEEAAELEKTMVEVPDVTGMDSKAAINVLRNKGLNYRIVPEDTEGSFVVIDQLPKAGSEAESQSTVYIYSQ